MQRKVHGHGVQCLLGHDHCLALEVQLGIHHSRQLYGNDRIRRNVCTPVSANEGPWAGSTEGLSRTSCRRGKLRLQPGTLVPHLRKNLTRQTFVPRGPASSVPPDVSSWVPNAWRPIVPPGAVHARLSDGWSEQAYKDTSAVTPCSCNGEQWCRLGLAATSCMTNLGIRPICPEVLERTDMQCELEWHGSILARPSMVSRCSDPWSPHALRRMSRNLRRLENQSR
jgi:hypothetical protein